MLKLNEILNKISELEYEISEILSIEFYTDCSGYIHSYQDEYFCFENLKDLGQFLKLDNDYIIKNKRKYPICDK